MHVNEILDKLFEKLLKAICYEMEEYLESKKVEKYIKILNHTGMMTSKWKQMVEDEKKFNKFKGHGSQKNRLKLNLDISCNILTKL